MRYPRASSSSPQWGLHPSGIVTDPCLPRGFGPPATWLIATTNWYGEPAAVRREAVTHSSGSRCPWAHPAWGPGRSSGCAGLLTEVPTRRSVSSSSTTGSMRWASRSHSCSDSWATIPSRPATAARPCGTRRVLNPTRAPASRGGNSPAATGPARALRRSAGPSPATATAGSPTSASSPTGLSPIATVGRFGTVMRRWSPPTRCGRPGNGGRVRRDLYVSGSDR
jgi:hypothetical protein